MLEAVTGLVVKDIAQSQPRRLSGKCVLNRNKYFLRPRAGICSRPSGVLSVWSDDV